MSRRFVRFFTASLMILATEFSLRADPIVFDPDGAGNASKVTVNTFQFGAGNSLAQGSIPFTSGDNFQLLFQAQLNSIATNTGVQITPAGLNAAGFVGAIAPYEITVVGSVTETVTNVNANLPPRATFRLSGTQAANSFIELYFDPAQNASALAGTGYNDGTLILRGVPAAANPDVGTFSQTNPQPTPAANFDSFTSNDYGTTTSVVGIGATKLDVTVTFVNSSFFIAPVSGDTGRQLHVGDVISFDLSQAAPFDKIDPSHKFVNAANSGTGAGPTPAATPSIGANNGISGPDLQTQTLIATSVKASSGTTPTPTPTGTPTPTPSATPTPTPTPTATPTFPKVVISSSKQEIREGNDAIITFTLKTTALHSDLTINYTTGGTATLNTDYTLSGTPGMVVIPASTNAAAITLHAITDSQPEPNGEVVKIFIQPGTGYSVPAQPDAKRVNVFIAD